MSTRRTRQADESQQGSNGKNGHGGAAVSGNGKSLMWPEGREFKLIVIGASAGGVEALTRVVRTLPPSLPAAVFVVLHVSASGPSLLPEILSRGGHLPAVHARDGMAIEPGRIYVAPPDYHLLIKPGQMVLTRGPKENNARPAVDTLFRTASRQYGPWVIGVVLSGGLDDGTLGLMDIKRFKGVAVVQDPQEALFPGMPSSAVENVQVDYVLRLDEMGTLLTQLAREPVSAGKGAAFMKGNNRANEPDVAEVGNDDLKTGNMTGPPSKFTCPECGGALWELQNGRLIRYRCHIGHGYTAETLMEAQTVRLEDALWAALRALEETAGMRRRMAGRAKKGGWDLMARNYEEQAAHAESRAGLIRSVLVEDDPDDVTKRSAKETQAHAIASRDPDAGKMLKKQPKVPLPAGPTPPPESPEMQGQNWGASRGRAKGQGNGSGGGAAGKPKKKRKSK